MTDTTSATGGCACIRKAKEAVREWDKTRSLPGHGYGRMVTVSEVLMELPAACTCTPSPRLGCVCCDVLDLMPKCEHCCTPSRDEGPIVAALNWILHTLNAAAENGVTWESEHLALAAGSLRGMIAEHATVSREARVKEYRRRLKAKIADAFFERHRPGLVEALETLDAMFPQHTEAAP